MLPTLRVDPDGANDAVSAKLDAVRMNHQQGQLVEGSWSFFIAATRRFGDDEHPCWGTVGFGNRRSNDPLLAGLSYQASPPVKAMAEYDSRNVNAGAAYDINGRWDEGKWHPVFLVGLTDLDRVTLSLGLTYSGSPVGRE